MGVGPLPLGPPVGRDLEFRSFIIGADASVGVEPGVSVLSRLDVRPNLTMEAHGGQWCPESKGANGVQWES